VSNVAGIRWLEPRNVNIQGLPYGREGDAFYVEDTDRDGEPLGIALIYTNNTWVRFSGSYESIAMSEDMNGFMERIYCDADLTTYLDEKLVDYSKGGFDPTLDEPTYIIPPEPMHRACFIINRIPQKFWERVVRVGLEHIVAKYDCELKYRWREFISETNDDMHLVFYVVNK